MRDITRTSNARAQLNDGHAHRRSKMRMVIQRIRLSGFERTLRSHVSYTAHRDGLQNPHYRLLTDSRSQSRSQQPVIQYGEVHFNQEYFNMSPVAGGFKTSHSRNVTVSDSVFLRNLGTGLWFDESSYDIKILNNDSIGNAGHGLDTEISDKAQFVNNLVVSNGGSGIKVINTSDVDIWNNTLAKNSTTTSERNLNIVMDTRRWATATSSSQKDLRQGVATPPDMTWITGPTNAHNNVIAGGSGQLPDVRRGLLASVHGRATQDHRGRQRLSAAVGQRSYLGCRMVAREDQ
ncbi:right-handed parallel beta-helix repeat-containing protein [Paraburkholderia phymatum]|uniref:Right-handed parallel beta-helix repeat-containing protein n=1 Tax=Paraburkholderia phymatum TaxID=148447 RepID=A0ACC6U1D6_9BURK